jgi:hypothetical protein
LRWGQWTQWDLFALFWSESAASDPVVDAEWQAVGAATRKGAVPSEFAQIVLLSPETERQVGAVHRHAAAAPALTRVAADSIGTR